MHASQSTIKLLFRLWHHLGSRRWQLTYLLVLIVVSSFAEIVTIGAVLPFLGVLTAPERVFSHSTAQPFFHFLGLTSADQLLIPLTLGFVLVTIFAGLIRLLLLWTSTRLSFAIGADLSMSIYHRTLYQPYETHLSRNNSEVINSIFGKSNDIVHSIVLPAFTIISATVMLVAILTALLVIDPFVAFCAFGGFGLIYLTIFLFTRKRLLFNGKCIARESTNVMKSLQEGLGGIRDIIIDGSQPIYCEIYRKADHPLRRAQGDNLFISLSPRYFVETLGILLIAFLAYTLASQSEGVVNVIPTLGALALGAQRLLPILQHAYGSWSHITGSQASLEDVLNLLDQPLPSYASQLKLKPLPFRRQINLNQVSFRYGQRSPFVLKNIDLSIAKGTRMGFIGSTGSGKSTLLDLVMSLLQPTGGSLEIDGEAVNTSNQRAWQTQIAHVPQSIFLSDGTIEENIAFGVPSVEIDSDRVRDAARRAQVADVIEAWAGGYQTLVGERGVRLSGGQRQRIGIARALYKQANVIVLDEATSALDNETEYSVMQAIENLSDDLTILIVAHRLSTLRICDQIVELQSGTIKRICTYKDIVLN
jgi:ABC-type multidrug transport system fused ATPase/permease subunit